MKPKEIRFNPKIDFGQKIIEDSRVWDWIREQYSSTEVKHTKVYLFLKDFTEKCSIQLDSLRQGKEYSTEGLIRIVNSMYESGEFTSVDINVENDTVSYAFKSETEELKFQISRL